MLYTSNDRIDRVSKAPPQGAPQCNEKGLLQIHWQKPTLKKNWKGFSTEQFFNCLLAKINVDQRHFLKAILVCLLIILAKYIMQKCSKARQKSDFSFRVSLASLTVSERPKILWMLKNSTSGVLVEMLVSKGIAKLMSILSSSYFFEHSSLKIHCIHAEMLVSKDTDNFILSIIYIFLLSRRCQRSCLTIK